MLEQRLRGRVVLFLQVCESEVEEKAGIVGSEFEGASIYVDGIPGASRARVDDSEIAKRADIVGLRFEDSTKALLCCG